jgi:hypoxanthine phosphoribosyltransferase
MPAIEKVLISEPRLRRRVAELAQEIRREFGEGELTVIAVLNGGLIFAADLVRQLPFPLRLDYIGLSAYDGERRPTTGKVTVERLMRLDVRRRNVLVVDDILDTGLTLQKIHTLMRGQKPKQLKVCVLLEKNVPRCVKIKPDFVGFKIPNQFVVGYGLDYRENYRNLPYIGVLKE